MKPQICICVDSSFAHQIHYVYNSIKKFCKQFDFNILFSDNVNSKTINKWKKRATIYPNIQLHPLIDCSNLKGIRNHIRSQAMYFRYFAPTIINTDRLIYTDIDAIFNADITELWDMDLGDKLVAAPLDPFRSKPIELVYDQTKGDPKYPFGAYETHFASGLLVINAKLWREENIFNKMIDIYKGHCMLDMLLFNIACKDRIKALPDEWCAPANFMIDDKCYITNKKYDNIKCYHWNGEKPWVSTRPYQEVWDAYSSTGN